MGLKLVKTESSASYPVFQKEFEVAQGGFKLDTTGLPAGEIVPTGTPIACDEELRTAKVFVSGALIASATNVATTYNVVKGHFFNVGDNVGVAVGGKAVDITGINTSNPAYDVITLSATLGVALNIGDILFKSNGVGASNCDLHVVPTGLLWDNAKIEDNVTVASVLRGTIYSKRVLNGIPADVKAVLPMIVFSNSN